MNGILKVVKFHLNKRSAFFAMPLYILLAGMLISVIIALAILRTGVSPDSPAYINGARGNAGLLYAVSGYLGYLGVQAVATTFPFAVALGTTRRAYVWGTALTNALLAAYVAVVIAVILGLELATNHWFVGIYIADTTMLGSGHVGWLLINVFLFLFSLLSVGGLFAAAWVRFGSKGSIALALIFAVLIALLVLLLSPDLAVIIANYRPWQGITVGVLIPVVSLLGTWMVMRRASVR